MGAKKLPAAPQMTKSIRPNVSSVCRCSRLVSASIKEIDGKQIYLLNGCFEVVNLSYIARSCNTLCAIACTLLQLLCSGVQSIKLSSYNGCIGAMLHNLLCHCLANTRPSSCAEQHLSLEDVLLEDARRRCSHRLEDSLIVAVCHCC
jgi:hypothetical protein